MALSVPRLSKCEKNFWKFCMLINRTVPAAVRSYFDLQFPPCDLPNTINTNRSTIYNLINIKIINETQVELLQRIQGTTWPNSRSPTTGPATSSEDFDVTLMICLIRNLTNIPRPSGGWDAKPDPLEKTPGAYIARIKYHRNRLAHLPGTQMIMDDSEFQSSWSSIVEAVTYLHGSKPPMYINEILNLDLDGSEAAVIVDKLTKNLNDVRSEFAVYKDGHLPRNIADNIEDTVSRWRVDDELYHETKPTKASKKAAKTSSITILSGSSGAGKTATARHVALQLSIEGYSVVPVDSVDKVIDFRRKNTKQVFLIDDMFGKYSLDMVKLGQWENLTPQLESVLNQEGVKLLCTLRNSIAISDVFSVNNSILNNRSQQVDFENFKYKLTFNEKQTILLNHLIKHNKKSHLSEVERNTCCRGTFAFPLHCRLFVSNSRWFDKKGDFFTKNYVVIKDELSEIYLKDKKLYCAFVLIMMFGGKLSTHLIDVSTDLNEKDPEVVNAMECIFDSCGLSRVISRSKFIEILNATQGTYTTKSNCGTYYEFVHDLLLEVVCFHFSSVNAKVLMKYCDIKFLCDRVTKLNPSDRDDDCMIYVCDEAEIALCSRFIKELKKGRCIAILSSQPIKDKGFVQSLKCSIEEDTSSFKKLLNTAGRPFTRWPSNISKSSFKYEALRMADLGHSLLHWIVATGCYHLFVLFSNKMSKCQLFFYLDKQEFFSHEPVLPLAIMSGNTKLCEFIFDLGANTTNHKIQSALRKYVEKSNKTDVLELFMKRNIKINFTDHQKKNLLFYAMVSKNKIMEEFILSSDFTAGSLSKAIFDSDIAKVRDGLSVDNINEKTGFGWSVFHIAAYKGNLDMFKALIELQNKIRGKPKTQLLWAVRKKDSIGLTPLHIATIVNETKMVKFLTRVEGSVLDRDLSGNTPLKYCTGAEIGVNLIKVVLKNNECDLESGTEYTEEDFEVGYQPTYTEELVQPSLWEMIYIVLINLQLLAFTTQFCRRKIDRANRNGNTLLHEISNKVSSNGSSRVAQILKSNNASFHLYNYNGCLSHPSSKIAFIENSYRYNKLWFDYIRKYSSRERRVLLIMFALFFSASLSCSIVSYLTLTSRNPEKGMGQFWLIHIFSVIVVLVGNFLLQSIRLKVQHTFKRTMFNSIYFISFYFLILLCVEETRNSSPWGLLAYFLITYVIIIFGYGFFDIQTNILRIKHNQANIVLFFPSFVSFLVTIIEFVIFISFFASDLKIKEIYHILGTFEMKQPLFLLGVFMSFLSLIIYIMLIPPLAYLFSLSIMNSNFTKCVKMKDDLFGKDSRPSIFFQTVLLSFFLFILLIFDIFLTSSVTTV